jgi:hypothetical protein
MRKFDKYLFHCNCPVIENNTMESELKITLLGEMLK